MTVRIARFIPLALALVAGTAGAGPLEEARQQLDSAYESFGELYQGSFRHHGRGHASWQYRGHTSGRGVGELNIDQAAEHRGDFQAALDLAAAALEGAEGAVEGPGDYARLTQAITDYHTLVDFGNTISLRAYSRDGNPGSAPLLHGHQTKDWTAPVVGEFDAAAFRQFAEAQLLAIEEASDTVPLLSCDSDSNSGYHEVSNHFTNILHTTNPQEVASIREDRYMIGHADPYDALGVKETAWEILEPTLRFKGARNATRAYLWASRSSRPAPEFDLPIQGEDLLGYKMADWETLVEWAQVVKIRFGTRSPRRNFYLLRSQFPTETGRRDRGNEYIRRHIFREPRGGTETIAIDRESSRDLPEHELFPDGPEGEVPVPGGPLPLDDEPGYNDLLGFPG